MSDIPVTDAPIHQALNALNRIEAEKNRAAKVAILQELKDNAVAQWMFYIDNPANRRLGIKVDDEMSRIYSGTAKPDEMTDRFIRIQAIVTELLQAKITKTEAKVELENLLVACSYTALFNEGLWYTRLINHGLRLGLPAVAVSDCWPELKVTSTLPYARSLLDSNDRVSERKASQIQYPCVAEPIIGGVLASVIIAGDTSYVTAFGGRKIACVQPWSDAIKQVFTDTPPVVVNGEFLTNAAYSGTVKTGQRERAAQICKSGLFCSDEDCIKTAQQELLFIIYDVYTASSLQTGIFNLPYGTAQSQMFCRSTILTAIAKQACRPTTKIHVVEQIICSNLDDLEDAHRYHLTQGFAGSIIKPCGAPIRFRPSECLFKWKETKKQTGYILSVFPIKETIGVEVFVPETNMTEHLHIPTKPLKDWFQVNKDVLNGYAVEFKETSTDGMSKMCILTKLVANKTPLTEIQIAALSERFGISLNETETMSLLQFQKAAALLTEEPNE